MSAKAEKYNFSDFTLDNYGRLLRFAKESYEFVSYSNFNAGANHILWRHDVDFSMHNALELARIENREGINATYFLLPHSEFYNLLETEIVSLVNEIIDMGHHIGLHFYSKFFFINDPNKLDKCLELEKEFLERVFKCEINVFSFHNPDQFELSCKDFKYGNMINTYAKIFQQEVAYCSDSNGYWRHKRLEDFLLENRGKSAQVLTHPEWWTKEIMSPKQKVMRCINGRASKVYSDYEQLLKIFGRENIDW